MNSLAILFKDSTICMKISGNEFTQLANIQMILPRDMFGTQLLLLACLLYLNETLGHKNMLLLI